VVVAAIISDKVQAASLLALPTLTIIQHRWPNASWIAARLNQTLNHKHQKTPVPASGHGGSSQHHTQSKGEATAVAPPGGS
jgi:hypothetical protein